MFFLHGSFDAKHADVIPSSFLCSTCQNLEGKKCVSGNLEGIGKFVNHGSNSIDKILCPSFGPSLCPRSFLKRTSVSTGIFETFYRGEQNPWVKGSVPVLF